MSLLSSNEHLLSTHRGLGADLGPGAMAVNRTGKDCGLIVLIFWLKEK